MDKLLDLEIQEIEKEISKLRTTHSTFIEWLEYKRDQKRVSKLKRHRIRLLTYRSMPNFIVLDSPWRY